ncbi:hypothetical protein ACMD2_07298 [Ananas comosus]|uniref:Uncharacterized protein n=1 Tax=Ananas comosus TaxID=4615 RepID=A0A199VKA7_ANACO|nr:hypothetical protein ACMD2_07298 [Ananas comosus]
MLRRLALRSSSSLADAPPFRSRERKLLDPVFSGGRALHPHPHPHPHALALARSFLDLHKMGSREAIEKEKTRLAFLPDLAFALSFFVHYLAPPRLFALNTRSDELSRGYFADISEIRQNGGKIALANKTIIPAAAAVNFPNLERMAESWSLPFVDAFSASGKIQIYEVSFIDSWLLSLGPVKHLFLKIMKKSSNPQRQIVYAFGDNYDFRKKLQILNLLTGENHVPLELLRTLVRASAGNLKDGWAILFCLDLVPWLWKSKASTWHVEKCSAYSVQS